MKDLQNIRLLPITVILLIAFNIMNLIQFFAVAEIISDSPVLFLVLIVIALLFISSGLFVLHKPVGWIILSSWFLVEFCLSITGLFLLGTELIGIWIVIDLLCYASYFHPSVWGIFFSDRQKMGKGFQLSFLIALASILLLLFCLSFSYGSHLIRTLLAVCVWRTVVGIYNMTKNK